MRRYRDFYTSESGGCQDNFQRNIASVASHKTSRALKSVLLGFSLTDLFRQQLAQTARQVVQNGRFIQATPAHNCRKICEFERTKVFNVFDIRKTIAAKRHKKRKKEARVHSTALLSGIEIA